MRAFRDTYLIGANDQPLRILDVGSASILGSTTYRDLFAMRGWEYVGLDAETGPNVDVAVKDPYSWTELTDASFDVVISGQAFEHIEWPWLTMMEIARVLKPRGLAAITAPSSGHAHRYPTDCWRYYPDGFPALAKYAGLSVIENDVDFGYVFKESADWGDAFAILQKPAHSDGEARTWTKRRAAARASAGRTGDMDEAKVPAADAPFDAALSSRDALARCYELERRTSAGFGWRWKLARRHFRISLRALFDPQRLKRW
jgi:SAM-dependent methyltransferase